MDDICRLSLQIYVLLDMDHLQMPLVMLKICSVSFSDMLRLQFEVVNTETKSNTKKKVKRKSE